MDVKGKVVQLLQLQTGMGKKGPWKKQEFIVETESQYPKKVCLSIWGDKIEQFSLSVGDKVSVSVDLESREYNGKWYTEARAWKLEKAGGSNTGNATPPPTEEPFFSQDTAGDDLPF